MPTRNNMIKAAFEIGNAIVDAESGYRFRVHTIGGNAFEGVPDEWTEDDTILQLDCVGGMPTPVIAVDHIAAITVLDVADDVSPETNFSALQIIRLAEKALGEAQHASAGNDATEGENADASTAYFKALRECRKFMAANKASPLNVSFVECIADSNRGIYIPQHFAEACSHWKGVQPDDLATLANGPDTEFYWEAWESVLDAAHYTDSKGRRWTLHQSGDLFAVADDMPEVERADFFAS